MIMRNRLKLGAATLAAAFGAVIAVGSPAAADDEFWTRSCGSKYYAFSDEYTSWTKKYSGGDCAGHAWVRIKVNGKWGAWKSSASQATIENGAGNTELSQHKGCETCTVYLLIP
jgi:hypothetical protein